MEVGNERLPVALRLVPRWEVSALRMGQTVGDLSSLRRGVERQEAGRGMAAEGLTRMSCLLFPTTRSWPYHGQLGFFLPQ